MLDTVIVGGGLCGLALATRLHAQGHRVTVYEARDRLGGRILSVPCTNANMLLDLGPTWFWPNTQPHITQLVAELGLASFPQHDDGSVLHLTDHGKEPQTMPVANLHNGAYRLTGGMAAMIDALAARLPPEIIHLQQELIAVQERDTQVELVFRRGTTATTVLAQQVILTIPPRLLEEHVQFIPPLENELRETMRATPTWMADQAKVVVGYTEPFWRTSGASGNAFVSHEQVTLGEIFDACDATGQHAALGGFFALPPAFRASIHPEVMPMLIASQLVQVFGTQAEQGEPHLHDWSTERFTSSRLDQTSLREHPHYANPALQRPLWNGKLLFGAAETATQGGGYMEGALVAAAHIQRTLLAALPVAAVPLSAINASYLHQFGTTVTALRRNALQHYRQHLHRHLTAQHKQQLTQQALLDTVTQIYRTALDELAKLPFDTAHVAIQQGRSDLTPTLLSSFEGFNAALLAEVVEFNRSSCAMSNLPQEHELAVDYVAAIKRELVPAWHQFALHLNDQLVGNKNTHA